MGAFSPACGLLFSPVNGSVAHHVHSNRCERLAGFDVNGLVDPVALLPVFDVDGLLTRCERNAGKTQFTFLTLTIALLHDMMTLTFYF